MGAAVKPTGHCGKHKFRPAREQNCLLFMPKPQREPTDIALNFKTPLAWRGSISEGLQTYLLRITPVSYTHLDVYKRQYLCEAAFSALTFIK